MSSHKYFKGDKGHYIFCDICGQACYDWEAVRLSTFTGRAGLLVCPNDADIVDYGLVPYTPTTERSVDYVRINHQNVTNGTAILDLETTNSLGT